MMLGLLIGWAAGAAVPPVPPPVQLQLPAPEQGVAPLLESVKAGSWAGQRATCQLPPAWPQLRVAERFPSPIPLQDPWQVVWENIALSDAQLAQLARDPQLATLTQEEMKRRGTWVYLGMGLTAAGAAVSSVGWVLYGQDQMSQEVTLSIAVGGLLMGVAGVLLTTHSIQSPLEPHLAPTPNHRISRPQAEALVDTINARLQAEYCKEPP